MAIYHLAAQIITRSHGRCATAAAAYRAGQKLTDERTGLTFNYSRKKEVAYRRIIAPKHAPEWVYDRQALWSAVEMTEKRRDAQLCREIHVSLPHELTLVQQTRLIETFVITQFVRNGMIADVAIHSKAGNCHAHVMLTMRDISAIGFGPKRRDWNAVEELEIWRSKWASHTNRKLTA